MLHHRFSRVGLLLLGLLVALAAIGVSSALWSEQLTINGNVATGSLEVDFDGGATIENELWGLEKDVAECVAITTGGDYPDSRIQFDISNGYPSFECWATFYVRNTGSIPVHLEQPQQAYLGTPSGTPTPDAVTIELLDAETTLPNGAVVPACYPPEYQLHAGDVVPCTMYFHVEQPAEQGADYNFTYRFLAWQFNETP